MYREPIRFNNQVGGVKVRQKGTKVTDDLVVAFASPFSSEFRFRIFSIVSGRPVVNLDFSSREEAIDYAERLDKVYHDYWFLLSEYPKMSIPQVCMWSVPNGIRIYVSLSSLEDRDTITFTDLKRAYIAAENKVDDYMKFPQKG